MPRIHFVVLQPTPFCNIACKYCYLPHRSSKARMSVDTIAQTFSRLFSSGWVADELDVVWHAGEPLTLPIDYYTQAIEEIARHSPSTTKLQHRFQTNGMLVDDQWCAFFKKYNVAVGVSVDGPAEIHDANRVTRSGGPTFTETIAGIRRLRANAVDFSVISVVTAKTLGRARELFDFYRSEGIRGVCFNVEEVEGVNTASSLLAIEKQIAFSHFLREIWNLNVETQALTFIREFSDGLGKIIRPVEDTRADNALTEPFAHISVDCEGNFSTFAPEFLGQKNSRYNDFIIGNVWRDSLADSLESVAFRRLHEDVLAGVELCRSSCEYFPVCGGGSPVNKLYENGTIASGETMFCRLSVKTVSDLALEIIETSASENQLTANQSLPPIVKQGLPPSGASAPRANASDPSDSAKSTSSTSRRVGVEAMRGDRLLVYSRDVGDIADRLEVGSADPRPPGQCGLWSYEQNSIVPLSTWRKFTEHEISETVVRTPPDFGVGIGVIRIPSEVLGSFEALRTAAAARKEKREIDELVADARVVAGIDAVTRHVAERFLEKRPDKAEHAIVGGVAVKPPGLPTVTSLSDSRTLIGIHVDDWYRHPIPQRKFSPNRICVNLGVEDRFLLFVNVPVHLMQSQLSHFGHPVPMLSGGTPIVRRFMNLKPDYPIMKLRIRPGEAYVAPTENCGHDASSAGLSTVDISLQLRGRFNLAAC